jgi:mannitol/fructose-specific phosphotransferase system IIA component
MSNKLKRSVQVKQKKDKENLVKEIRQIVKTAVINYGFLNSLLVRDDAEATYHNIMDYLESVDKMVEEFNS